MLTLDRQCFSISVYYRFAFLKKDNIIFHCFKWINSDFRQFQKMVNPYRVTVGCFIDEKNILITTIFFVYRNSNCGHAIFLKIILNLSANILTEFI